jgi:Mg/Co/Ni transporter MgtE
METDDAVDLLLQLDEPRRDPIIELLPAVQQRRVHALLGHDPATAGGLMSPDFVCVYAQATVAEALDRVRQSTAAAETLELVFVMNTARRVHGGMPLADLLRADTATPIGEIAPIPRVVRLDAELEEVARMMTDFDLTVIGVVDHEQRLQGVVTVDDVLELVLPRGWRRSFNLGDG